MALGKIEEMGGGVQGEISYSAARSQGHVVSRSDECFGPSLARVVGLCVGRRPVCCVRCGVLCRRALGSGRLGKDDVVSVSVCGV